MEDQIKRVVDLKAPVGRVWRALTDHQEFGQWFRVRLDQPFEAGGISTGQITHPGCEHMKWKAHIKEMEPERLFSFTWCPVADDPEIGTDNEPLTRVEFRLEPTGDGTRLVITESGFSSLPDEARRITAMRRNSGGWDGQVRNIAAHVES